MTMQMRGARAVRGGRGTKFEATLDISAVYAILEMQEACRKPTRRLKLLSYVAVHFSGWDGYIAFGANLHRNHSTKTMTMAMRSSFFPIGSTSLLHTESPDLRGKSGGVTGDQHPLARLL
jgi:hypothetical protein